MVLCMADASLCASSLRAALSEDSLRVDRLYSETLVVRGNVNRIALVPSVRINRTADYLSTIDSVAGVNGDITIQGVGFRANGSGSDATVPDCNPRSWKKHV